MHRHHDGTHGHGCVTVTAVEVSETAACNLCLQFMPAVYAILLHFSGIGSLQQPFRAACVSLSLLWAFLLSSTTRVTPVCDVAVLRRMRATCWLPAAVLQRQVLLPSLQTWASAGASSSIRRTGQQTRCGGLHTHGISVRWNRRV
jgi:hypothetical protein